MRQANKKEDKEMAKAKGLTYDELMALALENYDRGGDQTYECWDEKTFNLYVSMFGAMTKRKALDMFRRDKAVYDDISATAW